MTPLESKLVGPPQKDENLLSEMTIIGETPLSIGLFGMEFSKKGYRLNIVNCKNEPPKHKVYSVNVGADLNLFGIDDLMNLKDDEKLAQKTRSSGLIVVSNPQKEYDKIGNALGKALYNGYCRIDRHDRHYLNIICTDGYRPASTLRQNILKTWATLPNGNYLIGFGVSKFRITNAISKRECREKAGSISASPDWELLIENEINTRTMKKFGEYKILSTQKEIKKAEKEGRLSKHDQFLGKIVSPNVKYIDNIQYESHFK